MLAYILLGPGLLSTCRVCEQAYLHLDCLSCKIPLTVIITTNSVSHIAEILRLVGRCVSVEWTL